MKLKILILSFLAVFLVAGSASAIPVSFSDTSNYWPGWGNGSDDGNDTIGTPDFLGGTAEIDNGYLTKLTFEIRPKAYLNLWDKLAPGDLFIDVSADAEWDYFVDLIDKVENDGTVTGGTNKLYSFSHNLADPGYTMSAMPGYGYREDHPIGFSTATEGVTLSGISVTFSGWPTQPSGLDSVVTASFEFGGGGIDLLGSPFYIGWTVQCANDVVYETLNTPVPEPATMLLLGTGLVCFAGFGRKRFFKRG